MSQLLLQILSTSNMTLALKQVKRNKGRAGLDGITVDEIEQYIRANWQDIKGQIIHRKYKPTPVLRAEIPKPDGSKRKLGIPTVMDRIIQQAIVQVLTPLCEPHFSEYSYGFRPGRSCEDAIMQLLSYLNDGYEWIVDIDLEKFFDNVPQDRLMSRVHELIHDGDVESLIRKYLQAGVQIMGVYHESTQGTPQGGNLSPLLSNIMLNELDKELTKRGLRFTRYADDCIIAVSSEAAAKRVMYSVSRYIEQKLGLKVNMTKTKITRPNKLKYLGFGFYKNIKSQQWAPRPHQESVARFERKLKQLSKRSWSVSLTQRIEKLNQVIRGWVNYYSVGSMKKRLKRIDEHLRTRIRVVIWKQWKTKRKRLWGLAKLGMPKGMADKVSGWGDHYQFVALKSGIQYYITKEILRIRGLISIYDYYIERHALKVN